MLRDGKFIKEEPVKIGVYYIAPKRNIMTEEDLFVQNTLLPSKETKRYDWIEFAVGFSLVLYTLLGIYAWLE